jgi:hypothetical protein
VAQNVIVLISDLDNAIRGEVNVLESPDEAVRLVESLIESGFEQERIRVFLGDEMQLEVRHRPVVSLTNDAPQRTTKEVPAGGQETDSPAQKEAVPSPAATRAASLVLDGVQAQPFTRNGERFSTMFGPDVLSTV